MTKKLDKNLYKFEKRYLNRLDNIDGPYPGSKVVTEIATQSVFKDYFKNLADICYKDHAQMRNYLERTLILKLYPAIELSISKSEINQLNKEADKIIQRVINNVNDLENSNVKHISKKILKKAKEYKVRNLFSDKF